jgi:hypothetical protein
MRIAYHYCSLHTLTEIVKNGSFHMSNAFTMNDYKEVEWFKSIGRSVLEAERDRITGQKQAAGDPPPGTIRLPATSPALEYFHARLFNSLAKPAFDHVYCGCFSEPADDLSQWRGYADAARGVSIGIDLNAVVAANESNCHDLRIENVNYNEGKQREVAQGVITDWAVKVGDDIVGGMTKAAFAYSSLRRLAPVFKNPAFSSEREIRLIAQTTAHGDFDASVYDAGLLNGLPSDVDFRQRNGKLIPYVQVRLPLDAIHHVWLGPRFGGVIDEGAVRLLLSKHKIDAQLQRSKASYRED